MNGGAGDPQKDFLFRRERRCGWGCRFCLREVMAEGEEDGRRFREECWSDLSEGKRGVVPIAASTASDDNDKVTYWLTFYLGTLE